VRLNWLKHNRGGLAEIGIIVLMFVVLLALVTWFVPALSAQSVSGASQYLSDRGYQVISNDAYSALLNAISVNGTKADNAAALALAAVNAANDAVSRVNMFNSGAVYLFPNTTAKTVTLEANSTPDTFSAWTELKDNTNATFSAIFATVGGYISDINIYGIDGGTQSNSNWILELSYGGGIYGLS
jgi:hypothetical protein